MDRNYEDAQAARDAATILFLTTIIILSIKVIEKLCTISTELTIWSYQVVNALRRKKSKQDYSFIFSSDDFRRCVRLLESTSVVLILVSVIMFFLLNLSFTWFLSCISLLLFLNLIFKFFYLHLLNKIDIVSTVFLTIGCYISHIVPTFVILSSFLFLPSLIGILDYTSHPAVYSGDSGSLEKPDDRLISELFTHKTHGILNVNMEELKFPSPRVINIASEHPSYLLVILESIERKDNQTKSNPGIYVIGIQNGKTASVPLRRGLYQVYVVKEVFSESKLHLQAYRKSQQLVIRNQKSITLRIGSMLENQYIPTDLGSISKLVKEVSNPYGLKLYE